MDLASKSLHRGTGTRTVRPVRVAFTLILALSQDALRQPPSGPTSLPAAFSNHPAGHRAEGRGQHARAGAGIPQRRSSVASCSSKLRRRKWSSTRRVTATASAVGWGGLAGWDSARARRRAGGSGGSGAARGSHGEQEAAMVEFGESRWPRRRRGTREGGRGKPKRGDPLPPRHCRRPLPRAAVPEVLLQRADRSTAGRLQHEIVAQGGARRRTAPLPASPAGTRAWAPAQRGGARGNAGCSCSPAAVASARRSRGGGSRASATAGDAARRRRCNLWEGMQADSTRTEIR
jgi:hypothetical protein